MCSPEMLLLCGVYAASLPWFGRNLATNPPVPSLCAARVADKRRLLLKTLVRRARSPILLGRLGPCSYQAAMTKTILLLNGPNLNMLGLREPETYGSETLGDVETKVAAALPDGFALDARQSNHEGQLVDWIQAARGTAGGIIINPGAYTHTSIAILDALHIFEGPVIEVHISNIYQREAFRHKSFVSPRADGVIAGFGTDGYVAAARRLVSLLNS